MREGLQHLGVEGIHVVRGDGPCPGPEKEVAELRIVSLPHLLVEDDDIGEAVPDQLSKGDSRTFRCLPERLGLDGRELVEVSHKNDDGESTEDGSGFLPNRSNPAALLIDSVQHVDLINEQDGLPCHSE